MRATDAEALERQFVELLSEGGPAERGGAAPTLADAVERFRQSFFGSASEAEQGAAADGGS
ncbi:MAG: hypothetical protein U0796_14525 [Gemmatales bacterium]